MKNCNKYLFTQLLEECASGQTVWWQLVRPILAEAAIQELSAHIIEIDSEAKIMLGMDIGK